MERRSDDWLVNIRNAAGAVAVILLIATPWLNLPWAFCLVASAICVAAHFFHKHRSTSHVEIKSRQADAPLSPAAMNVIARRNIIADFGEFIEKTAPSPADIYDLAALPHPKEKILNAIILEITRTDSLAERETLKASAVLLAGFQNDVGPKALTPLGAARWQNFNEKVERDLLDISAKINAAIKLGDLMSREKKREVFGL